MKHVRMGLALVTAWLLALLIAYLIAQTHIGIMTLQAIGLLLIDTGAVAALVLISGAVGTLIMPDLPRLSELARAVLRALIGLGILSVSVLLIGMVGLIPPRWLAWLITLALLAVFYKPASRWARELWDMVDLLFTYSPDPLTRWILRLVIVMLGLALLPTMSPPIAWDGLTYHLAGPQQYIEVGRIVPFAENHFLGFPQLVEMLFLWLMLLARPQTAALLHWVFGVLTLLLIMGVGRQMRRPIVGWVAAAVLLAGYTFWNEFTWPYNDLALTAYVTGAVILILAASEISSARRAAFMPWIGIFAGLAMSIKYTAAGATIGIAMALFWITRHEPITLRIQRFAWIIGIALLVFAPWLIKNGLHYQNPVAPFGVGTSAFDEFDQWYYLRPGTGLSLPELLILPAQATVFGSEGRAPYGGSIGALVFGLIPLAAVGWKFREPSEKETLIALAVFVIPAYLVWLIGTGVSWFLVQSRLLFPIFPALALIGALGLDGLGSLRTVRDLTKFIRIAVLIALSAGALSALISVSRIAPLRVMLGLQSSDEFLTERLGVHYVAMQQINTLPDDARVLTLWEPRIYYCDKRCIPDSMIDQWWHDRQVYGTPENILEHWRDQGYTHVLIFESGWRFLYEQEPHEPMTEADIAALEEMRTRLTLIWDGYGAYTLYAIP